MREACKVDMIILYSLYNLVAVRKRNRGGNSLTVTENKSSNAHNYDLTLLYYSCQNEFLFSVTVEFCLAQQKLVVNVWP